MCTVPGASSGGLCQGMGADSAQSTLIVAGSSSKRAMLRRTRVGSSSHGHQVSVQGGGRDVRDHRGGVDQLAPCSVITPVTRRDDVTIRCTRVSVRMRPPRLVRRSTMRLGEPARATARHRETVALSDHGQQQAEDARADGGHGNVGVQGVAGQQQPGLLGAEARRDERRRRLQQRADVVQSADRRQPGERLQPAAHGRERAQQGLDQRRPDALPVAAEPQPRLTVTAMVFVEPGRRALRARGAVAPNHRPGAAGRARRGRGTTPARAPPAAAS